MKILQIISCNDMRLGRRCLFLALLENNAGNTRVFPAFSEESLDADEIFDLYQSTYANWLDRNDVRDADADNWADEPTAPSLLGEVFDQARPYLSVDLYERVRRDLGR